jgi:2'-5' RNA ligase
VSQTLRAFLAFDIESASVRKKFSLAQTLLLQTGADLKIVEKENIHITVRFLGDITASMVDRIFDDMKRVKFAPFNIQIKGLGAFPDISYPRVVWAGITEGADQLRNVFDQMEPKLSQMGFSSENRGFSAHLTLARVRSGRNKVQLTKFLSDNSDFEFGFVSADCLRLKQSDLTPRGPVYSTLREFCPSS